MVFMAGERKREARCVWADCCGVSCLAPEGQVSWGLTLDKSWFRNTRDTSQQQCHHPPSTQHCSAIEFKDCLVYPVISHSLIIINEATWSFPKTSASDAQTATWCHTSRHLWNVYVQQALYLLWRSFLIYGEVNWSSFDHLIVSTNTIYPYWEYFNCLNHIYLWISIAGITVSKIIFAYLWTLIQQVH